MAKTTLTLSAVAVILGLAIPAVANGQAIPRTAGSSGSTGSTSSGGTSSGSGGSSGGGGSVSSGSGVSQPPSNPGAARAGIGNDGSSVVPTIINRGHVTPQPPPPGGVAARVAPVDFSADRRTGGAATGDGGLGFSSSLANFRVRGDNPVTGLAAPRGNSFGGGAGGDLVSFPFYGPWGPWYPWYTPGFGWYVGFYGYNPWYYGATCWGWGRYGAWYDPYGYCWSSYYFGAPTSYVEIAGTHHAAKQIEPATGSLRILTSPKTASVYIDDALAGTVDEFDGLSDHLEVDKGRHTLSIRADGYETATQDVTVQGGKTLTVRVAMKKVK